MENKYMKFDPLHCQKSYFDKSVTLHYNGIFDKPAAIEFIKQSYPDFQGLKITEHITPSFFRGIENVGTVVFI